MEKALDAIRPTGKVLASLELAAGDPHLAFTGLWLGKGTTTERWSYASDQPIPGANSCFGVRACRGPCPVLALPMQQLMYCSYSVVRRLSHSHFY